MNAMVMVLKSLRMDQVLQHTNLMRALSFIEFTPGFHLTGSRFFGNVHEGSDYDFFINEDCDVFPTLLDLGFRVDWNSDYRDSDPSVRSVLVFTSGDVQIHVQIIKAHYYNAKVSAQEKIKGFFAIAPDFMHRMSKEDMKKIWRRSISFS